MSNMSQNQEIIEAKLCAYIDGVLDPEGRAEIEKHLEANPQHRRLLESLRATRDLLRWLPREPAPPELAESLNGQLERSVLLDYDGAALQPSRWPRILASAAIIALTAGLAAAVFMALPGSQKNPAIALRGDGQSQTLPSDVSASPVAPAPSANFDVTERESERMHGEIAPARNENRGAPKDGADNALAGKPLADAANFDEGELGKKTAELDQLALQVSQDPDAFVAAANNDRAAATEPVAPAANAVVLLVRSNSPQATEQQLTRYFVDNQIRWRQASAPQLEKARLDAVTGVARAGGYAAKSLPDSTRANQLESLANDEQKNSPAAGIRGAESQPSQDFAVDVVPRGHAPLPEALTQNAMPRQSPSQRQVIQSNLSNRFEGNGMYVAQMSRRQAAVLNSAINREGARAAGLTDWNAQTDGLGADTATGKEKSAPSAAPAGPPGSLSERGTPTTNPSAYGRNLRSRNEAVGREPVRDRPLSSYADQRTNATTQPTNDARSDNEAASTDLGTGAGRGLGYRDEVLQRAKIVDATQPSQSLSERQKPTTRFADEPVNVVILVQSDDLAATDEPTTRPTTQQAAPGPAETAQSQPIQPH